MKTGRAGRRMTGPWRDQACLVMNQRDLLGREGWRRRRGRLEEEGIRPHLKGGTSESYCLHLPLLLKVVDACAGLKARWGW